jgi:predicted DNA-binding transcriptional regulator AlpA
VPLQSYDQVAAHFGVDRQTLARWVKERKFPRPLAIGTRRYWSATAINKWVLAQEDRLRDEETVQRLVAAS